MLFKSIQLLLILTLASAPSPAFAFDGSSSALEAQPAGPTAEPSEPLALTAPISTATPPPLVAVRAPWKKSHVWTIIGTCGFLTGAAIAGVTTYFVSQGYGVLDTSNPSNPFWGWGMSGAWQANDLGKYPSEVKERYMDMTYGADGLGFNIFRYNIGGGENPDSHHYNNQAIQPVEGVYNWSADPHQRWMLKAARARGANIFEAFSNSPPYWMTRSQCSAGAYDGGQNNLPTEKFGLFGQYLAKVIKHLNEDPDLNITIHSLSPMNEATETWWYAGHGQEGAHFSRDTHDQLFRAIGKALEDEGLHTKLAAGEDFGYEATRLGLLALSPEAYRYIGQVNTHGYDQTNGQSVAALARKLGIANTESEMGCCFSNPPAGQNDEMYGALALSSNIRRALGEFRASAWMIWQTNWGVIDLAGGKLIKLKQAYGIEQYSKFIRPGYQMIAVNDPQTLAAIGPATQAKEGTSRKHVLVITNNQLTEMSKTFRFGKLYFPYPFAQVYRTSNSENLVALQELPIDSNNNIQISVPPRSIVTLVLEAVE